jgi:hypothetical protein
LIEKNLSKNTLYKIYKDHSWSVSNENHRNLVIIDGGQFEFYVSPQVRNSRIPILFDQTIMGPLLNKWVPQKYKVIKSSKDFKQILHEYISKSYQNNSASMQYHSFWTTQVQARFDNGVTLMVKRHISKDLLFVGQAR